MKLSNTQGLLLGAGAFYLLSQLATKATEQVVPGTPRLLNTDWDFTSLTMDLEMPIDNRTPLPVSFDGLQGIIKYGVYNLAPINVSGPVTIEGNTITPVTFQVSIVYANLAQELLSLISNTSSQGLVLDSLVLSGTLYAAGLQIPVNQKISLV